ncbi:MAG TPA: hypothetical protein VK590_06855 [Saprospiraceae bacterium]|nr:hypothetical protein [Saprospiraceae bacterium]
MKYFYLAIFIIIGSFTLLTTSCRKELEINDSDSNFAINLRRDTSSGATRFNWDKANISNFRSYILVRSKDPIPIGLTPKVGSTDVEIVGEITKRDSTEFYDSNPPLASVLHYKLYIDIGSRFIESADIIDYQKVFVFNDFFDYINMDKDTSWAFMLNSQSGNLVVFDYAKNTLVAEKFLNIFSISPIVGIASGPEGNDRYLFVHDYSTLYKYKLPSLELVNSIPSYSQCFSLISNRNGLLISTNYDYNNSLNIWKQSSLTLIKGVSKPNYYENRYLILLDPTINRVAEISTYEVTAYNVNQTTGNISSSKNISINGSQANDQIVSSKDFQYFIPNLSGTVYNKDLQLVANNNFFNAMDYCFSDDSKFLYRATVENTGDVKLTQFSFPDMNLQDELVVTGFQLNRITYTNNSIGLFGTNNFTGEFIFKAVKFK